MAKSDSPMVALSILAGAALRWNRLAAEEKRLRADRDSERCEVGSRTEPTCWQAADRDRSGWPVTWADYCGACQRGAVLNQVRARLKRREGAARRALAKRAEQARVAMR